MLGMRRLKTLVRHRRALGVALTLTAGLSLLLVVLGQNRVNQQQAKTVRSAEARVTYLRRALESCLNAASNASASVAAYLRSQQGQIDIRVLRRMALDMIERVPPLDSIAVAPSNVIRWNFPAAGNEPSVGVHLLEIPGQRALIDRVITSRTPVLAGPLDLVQGGGATIHRVPVFISDSRGEAEHYWGLVNSRIGMEELLRGLAVNDLAALDRLAIRGRDGRGAQGEVFLGNPGLFQRPDVVVEQVSALDGTWQIVLAPAPMPSYVIRVEQWLVPLALLLGVLLGVSVFGYLRNQAALTRSEQRFRQMTRALNEIVFQMDRTGALTYLSPAYTRLTGRPLAPWLDTDWLTLFHSADHPGLSKAAHDLAQGSERSSPEVRAYLMCADATDTIPVALRLSQAVDADELVGIITDKQDEMAIERLSQYADIAFEHTDKPMVVLDARHRIQRMNPAYARLAGAPADDLLGQRLNRPAPNNWSRAEYRAMLEALRSRGFWSGDFVWQHDGQAEIYQVTINRAGLATDTDPYYTLVFVDLGSYHRDLKAARQEAARDPLTGLLNRKGLYDAFPSQCQQADTEGRQVALLMLDLDNFKPVNDIHGHGAGDQVLITLAERLAVWQQENPSALVVRLGGDELLVTLSCSTGEEVDRTARTLQSVITTPLALTETVTLAVGCSMGISLRPVDGDSLSVLMARADQRLYAVKAAGKGHFRRS